MATIPHRLPNLLAVGLLLVVLSMNLWPQIERLFVYFPTREVHFTPGNLGLEYEEIFLEVEPGQRIHGWFVPGTSPVTLLWFHGNGGNIGHRTDEIGLLHHRLGVNIFIFDYRGYGRSDGKPSETGMYRDAGVALAYLHSRPDVDPARVVYFGRSLGAAIAVDLAARQQPYGMVLVAPFASLEHMARLSFSWLPVHRLVREHFNSLERIGSLTAPLLVLHGERDEVVPPEQGRLLFGAATAPKRLQVLPTAGHNDTYYQGGEAYWQGLTDFLRDLESGLAP